MFAGGVTMASGGAMLLMVMIATTWSKQSSIKTTICSIGLLQRQAIHDGNRE
jgi:hypothetical protein